MSCFNCTGCTPTEDMNACFASVNFGQFSNGAVTLTFKNTADGSVHIATGTAAGGSLSITSANLPSFIGGVGYTVTASATWTLGGTVRSCVSVRFIFKKDKDGAVVTGTSETLTVCS